MRIPTEETRKRCLPESVLQETLAQARIQSRALAQLHGADPELIEEACLLGAWYCWETWDSSLGVRYRTWLRRTIEWFIGDLLRDDGRKRSQAYQDFCAVYDQVSLDAPASGADHSGESGTLLEELIADPAVDVAAAALQNLEQDTIYAGLRSREAAVFTLRYLAGHQRRVVAQALQVSPSRISQIEQETRDRFRDQGEQRRAAALDSGHRDRKPLPGKPSGPGTTVPLTPIFWEQTSAVTWEAPDGPFSWLIRRNSKAPVPRQYRALRDGQPVVRCTRVVTYPGRAQAEAAVDRIRYREYSNGNKSP